MHFLDLTLPTPHENVALEEAMVLQAEQGRLSETLRVWNAPSAFIVIGRGSKVAQEVELQQAAADEIPVIRRFSGGATILAAPGCFFYSVLLSLDKRPHLRMLDEAHRFVMGRVLDAIQLERPDVALDGTCDLVLGGRKASGNALRMTRDWVLYHGTLLLDMNLDAVEQYLRHPPREPEYRAGRSHEDFLVNLHIDSSRVVQHLRDVWEANARLEFSNELIQETERLTVEKYRSDAWTLAR